MEKKTNKFNENMLDFLCCPKCHSDFNYDKKESKLICIKCKKEFCIKDSIPILLDIEE